MQQPKIDDLKQFYSEVRSAGLESMNGASELVGMSVVCQKGTVAGSAFVIVDIHLMKWGHYAYTTQITASQVLHHQRAKDKTIRSCTLY